MSTTAQDPKTLLESILKNLGFEVGVNEIEKQGSTVLDNMPRQWTFAIAPTLSF